MRAKKLLSGQGRQKAAKTLPSPLQAALASLVIMGFPLSFPFLSFAAPFQIFTQIRMIAFHILLHLCILVQQELGAAGKIPEVHVEKCTKYWVGSIWYNQFLLVDF